MRKNYSGMLAAFGVVFSILSMAMFFFAEQMTAPGDMYADVPFANLQAMLLQTNAYLVAVGSAIMATILFCTSAIVSALNPPSE